MKNRIDRLAVSQDGRRLIHEDGSPFFYLADTAWELFHKLNREDAFRYLENRAEKGFTVIQAVALAEKDGLRRSNAYGRCPVKIDGNGRFDPLQMDVDGEYSYWDHVDAIVRRAGELGLYVAMLPAWGDKIRKEWGEGPELFTVDSAYQYGLWLGERYRDSGNIIWVLGGDRAFTTRSQLNIVDAMARGLKAGDGGRYLMTFHPAGGQHSADFVGDEAWLDFNMIQSGHTRSRFNYEMIAKDWRRFPHKPVLDGEANYEGHPENFRPENGFMDAADVRQSAYWAVFSGACGHAYGHHSVWNFVTLPDKDAPRGYYCADWTEALDYPGSGQMKHLRALMEKVCFEEARPEDSMVAGNLPGVNHVAVLRGEKWLMAYSAQGLTFELRLGCEFAGARAQWYNPRTGDEGEAFEVEKEGIRAFRPPRSGRGEDWVLLMRK